MSENAAADALAKAVDSKSFQPALFGYAVICQNQNAHPDIILALLDAIGSFAARLDGPYNAINMPYYALCATIKEAVTEQYGYYPGI